MPHSRHAQPYHTVVSLPVELLLVQGQHCVLSDVEVLTATISLTGSLTFCAVL